MTEKQKIRYLLGFIILFLLGCETKQDFSSSETSPIENSNNNSGFVDNIPDVMDGGVARPELRDKSDIYAKKAVIYFNQGALPVALKDAKKSLVVDASNPDGHLILARVYSRLGKKEKAELHYKMALKYNPKSFMINNTYASYLCNTGRIKEALIYYDKAIANPLNQHPEYIYSNAGNCLINTNPKKASTYLRKSLEVNKFFPPALLGMLKVRLKQKNYYSGRAFLVRYLEVGKHNPATLLAGIRIEKALGNQKKMESYRQILLTKYADSEEAQILFNGLKEEDNEENNHDSVN